VEAVRHAATAAERPNAAEQVADDEPPLPGSAWCRAAIWAFCSSPDLYSQRRSHTLVVSLLHLVSKNSVTFFLSVGCLLLGVMLGIAGAYAIIMPHYTKMASRTFFTAEAYKLGEDAQRSFYAYKHESKPVAIYALSEHLLPLKKAKDIPEKCSPAQ
jgi:hypothetical protein